MAQAIEAGIGATVTVEVGGALAPALLSARSTLTGYVKTISDGTFTFKGPGMRGVPHHMGRTVVLVRGGIHLVVMERGVSQWDPQLYRCGAGSGGRADGAGQIADGLSRGLRGPL